jgi:hypothetical protein
LHYLGATRVDGDGPGIITDGERDGPWYLFKGPPAPRQLAAYLVDSTSTVTEYGTKL